MNSKSIFVSVIVGIMVLGLYTNCGDGFSSEGVASNEDIQTRRSGSKCDPIIRNSFNSSFHAFLKSSCVACHNGGIGQGKFASPDGDIAFATFKDFGWPRISENAVDNNHAGGITGDKLKTQVDQLNIVWDQTKANYNKCLQSDSTEAKGQFDLLTNTSDVAATDKWETLTWDLNQNNFDNNFEYILDLTFKLDVQNYYGEGDIKPTEPVGILFRRPRVEFVGASIDKLYIEGINLMNNGIKLEDFGSWIQLIVLINKQEEKAGKVADSIIINDTQRSFTHIYSGDETIDSLAVSFINIIDNTGGKNASYIPPEPNEIIVDDGKPIITEKITYAMLTGTGNNAVFINNCFSCHGNGSTSGGLDLSSFTPARNKRVAIGQRINGIGRIMPQSGAMSLREIAIVEKWIADGAPQN